MLVKPNNEARTFAKDQSDKKRTNMIDLSDNTFIMGFFSEQVKGIFTRPVTINPQAQTLGLVQVIHPSLSFRTPAPRGDLPERQACCELRSGETVEIGTAERYACPA